MAVDKKFFVDINLQGNALNNATVGSNSDMSKAGSFRFDGSRLEYYDGSNPQLVANLDDIAAVTGGLILQGGYDAAANSPDIADNTAKKGQFWVVTEAGSFLGESVQVGDSIIAKVDNAGASIGHWLILQGNVVIATDTVDGIVRLATQTEVNTGTEGGAVVVTPATLQGKIDAQITPSINDKLSKTGGTMSGDIDMGGSGMITNAYSVASANLTSTNTYADDANFARLRSNDTGFADIKLKDNLDAESTKTIKNLPAPTAGGDAANKTYVDAAQTAAEAYADSLAPNYDAAGSAAAAQTAAETYTDTKFNGYSNVISVQTTDWTDTGSGYYEATVTHNLNTYFAHVTCRYELDASIIELGVHYANLNYLYVRSNTIPADNVTVFVTKVTQMV